MSQRHFAFWPKGLPRHLSLPETSLWYNVEVAARRWPSKPYLVFYDTRITFGQFKAEAEHLAGFLQQRCGVKKGDRVILFLQNSPQFALAYYAVLRADAVAIPVNPMNLTEELRHLAADSGAEVAFVAQDLYPQARPLLGDELRHVVVATYSDYLRETTDLAVPAAIAAERTPIGDPGVTLWTEALAEECVPGPHTAGPDDLAVMPYTSGTTGRPKGCMHTHRTAMFTAVAGVEWFATNQDAVYLAVLPWFHVTGMQGALSGPLYRGSTVIVLPRWDREAAAELIQRYRVTSWTAIPTMVIDFLSNPRITEYDLSSVSRMSGGGAAMPEAIAQKMRDLIGITYVEGYGLSETIAPSHINPPERPKKQCLGIPIFDTESRVVDPETLEALPPGEVGEILIAGPGVFLGYWNQPGATADAFVQIEGRRFFRSGDLGRIDEDGYFFMVDRLKRMINASGYKVWPAEVEAMLYHHPDVQEACVVSARDPHRGETVKAVVVLRPEGRGRVSEEAIVNWAREHMAAYKVPRIVEFVDNLPKSGTGKVMWRALQERETAPAGP